MPKRVRLDQRLVDLGFAPDIDSAKRSILSGVVMTDHCILDKPGQLIPPEWAIRVKGVDCPFVSKGGLKLEKAMRAFALSPRNLNCLDIGASTGGFTDVLLSGGAGFVTAVDVGYGQFSWKLRNDPRVRIVERTNFRLLPDDFFGNLFDLIVVDVSFISLELILPKAKKMLVFGGNILALIKPQFEANPRDVEKGGLVREVKTHRWVVEKLQARFAVSGLFLHGLTNATDNERNKNLEIFSWWRLEETHLGETLKEDFFETLAK